MKRARVDDKGQQPPDAQMPAASEVGGTGKDNGERVEKQEVVGRARPQDASSAKPLQVRVPKLEVLAVAMEWLEA